MPSQYTPDSPATIAAFRGSRCTQYVWVFLCAVPPHEYLARRQDEMRHDPEKVPALLRDALEMIRYGYNYGDRKGDRVTFDILERNVPLREAKQAKMRHIIRMVAEGHPLQNSEVERVEAYNERAQRRNAAREAREREQAQARTEAAARRDARRAEREALRAEADAKKAREQALYNWPAAPEGCRNIFAEEEIAQETEDAEPVVVGVARIGDTKDSAAKARRGINSTPLFFPHSPLGQRIIARRARGHKTRLRLLEVHPRAGLKARKDAWARRLGLGVAGVH